MFRSPAATATSAALLFCRRSVRTRPMSTTSPAPPRRATRTNEKRMRVAPRSSALRRRMVASISTPPLWRPGRQLDGPVADAGPERGRLVEGGAEAGAFSHGVGHGDLAVVGVPARDRA